jgi:hypothetical protein
MAENNLPPVPEGACWIIVGGNNPQYALVDIEDLPRLARYRWCTNNGYAYNRGVGMMQRFLMRTPDGLDTDHINGNRLDNRKCNLRYATRAENGMNRHSVRNLKGVQKERTGRFRAAITSRGFRHHIGVFDTREEAARAYDEAAMRLHGEFARLNYPTKPRPPE